MFVACGIWCLADVSSVSPSSEQTGSLIFRVDEVFDSEHDFHTGCQNVSHNQQQSFSGHYTNSDDQPTTNTRYCIRTLKPSFHVIAHDRRIAEITEAYDRSRSAIADDRPIPEVFPCNR